MAYQNGGAQFNSFDAAAAEFSLELSRQVFLITHIHTVHTDSVIRFTYSHYQGQERVLLLLCVYSGITGFQTPEHGAG